MSELILSIDVGGTHLRIGLLDSTLTMHAFEKVRSIPVFDTSNPIDALVALIDEFLHRHRTTSDAEPHTVGAIAIGFPSTVDRNRRVVLSTSNIVSLQNLRVADALEVVFGVPVCIDKDVNFLLRHDLHDLGLTDLPIVIGCYLGTGLGNAIAVRGEILVGANGVAGELGHIPVRGSQRVCGCGNTGCAETLASGIRLTEIAEQHFEGNLGSIFSHRPYGTEVLDFLDDVAFPIATEINVLDPSVVLLGGGVIDMAEFPKSQLEERIRCRVRRPLPHDELVIRYSQGGQHAGVIGGALTILADPDRPEYFSQAPQTLSASLTSRSAT